MRKLLAILAAVLACTSLPARAVVVFGNLGSDGSGGLDTINNDIRATNLIAQGFSTGTSSLLSLQSITLGLFGATAPGTISGAIDLYSNAGGTPGAVLHSSTNSAIGDTGKYTFNFVGATLDANQSYWVVPRYDLSWYFSQPNGAPTAQNLSGYVYTGTLRSTNNGPWVDTSSSYSISIQATEAIPEPDTWAVAVLLCGAAAWVARRRRAH
jgi:hypothetical protein